MPSAEPQTPSMPPPDERGFGKHVKRVLPRGLFRPLTVLFNKTLALLPYGPKYALGTRLRRDKTPYNLIESGDVVVQVGAPRDTLLAGRSRAVYFARLVGEGRVVVVEPDPDNVATLRRFVERAGLGSQMSIHACGAWSETTELTFLSSPSHPAANVLEGVQEISEEVRAARHYREVTVPVRALDEILDEENVAVPKLVSITTNGAELEILDGMRRTIGRGCPYISLASTGEGYLESMTERGYEYFARDDRGYCFRRRTER